MPSIRFNFIRAGVLRDEKERARLATATGLPSYQEICKECPHWLVQRDVNDVQACKHALVGKYLTVSHCWESPETPDLEAVQYKCIVDYLIKHPSIEYVWVDFWCMPQGKRSAAEEAEFKISLEHCNWLYLGASVLLIVDLSYVSRFWTQYEAWLSMQQASAFGLMAAPARLLRATIVCIHQASAEFEGKKLQLMWKEKSATEAHRMLSRPDVRVTNQNDKQIHLPKIARMHEFVAEVLIAHEEQQRLLPVANSAPPMPAAAPESQEVSWLRSFVLGHPSERRQRDAADKQRVGGHTSVPSPDPASAPPMPPLVKTKLANPAMRLAIEQSIEVATGCVDMGDRVLQTAASGGCSLAVFGNTGAGKSTFFNFLHGCQMESIKRAELGLGGSGKVVRVAAGSQKPELFPIGHENVSATFIPGVAKTDALGDGDTLVDCPGFSDNRGPEINIANAINIKRALVRFDAVRVVVLINHSSLKADRGKGVRELLKILKDLFGTPDRLLKSLGALMVGVSQAPPQVVNDDGDVEPTLSADVVSDLCNTSGFGEEDAKIIAALKERAFLFHPLDKGGDTWLKRGALLERIRRSMTPITDKNTFKTVLSLEDEAMVRTIATELGSRALKAVQAEDYAQTRRLLEQLTRMEVIDNPVATRMLEDAKQQVAAHLSSEMQIVAMREIMHEQFRAAEARIAKVHDALEQLSQTTLALASVAATRQTAIDYLAHRQTEVENMRRMRIEIEQAQHDRAQMQAKIQQMQEMVAADRARAEAMRQEAAAERMAAQRREAEMKAAQEAELRKVAKDIKLEASDEKRRELETLKQSMERDFESRRREASLQSQEQERQQAAMAQKLEEMARDKEASLEAMEKQKADAERRAAEAEREARAAEERKQKEREEAEAKRRREQAVVRMPPLPCARMRTHPLIAVQLIAVPSECPLIAL